MTTLTSTEFFIQLKDLNGNPKEEILEKLFHEFVTLTIQKIQEKDLKNLLRMMNFTLTEFKTLERKMSGPTFPVYGDFIHKSISFIKSELNLIQMEIAHPGLFPVEKQEFMSAPFRWLKSKADITEVLTLLYSSGCFGNFNGKEVPFSDVTNFFGYALNIDLKHVHSKLHQIKERKNPTPFMDKIINSYISQITERHR